MKRLLPIFAMMTAVALAGCTLGPFGAPPPTYTPLPTYTPFPTFTEAPTATATFLPSPTPIPSSTPTPEGGATATSPATPTSSEMQGVLAFGANLRTGPGTGYKSLGELSAGDVLAILGRDENGFWLNVRTDLGTIGWVAVRQFQGPIDIPHIPLASNIPTPNATEAILLTKTPGTPVVGPTKTGTPATATPTGSGSSTLTFTLNPGKPAVCQTITASTAGVFHVDTTTQDIKSFDAANPGSVVNQRAFKQDRSQVPTFVGVEVDGPMKPAQCSDSDKSCHAVTMKLCLAAGADAPTGGSDYSVNIIYGIGTQSYDQFFEETKATVPVVIRVVVP